VKRLELDLTVLILVIAALLDPPWGVPALLAYLTGRPFW
jgi:hypothetical protein